MFVGKEEATVQPHVSRNVYVWQFDRPTNLAALASYLSRASIMLQIAAALKAEKLILMTDVPGVLQDKDDVGTKYAELDIRRVKELVSEGIIAGGMIPKCVSVSLDFHPCICAREVGSNTPLRFILSGS